MQQWIIFCTWYQQRRVSTSIASSFFSTIRKSQNIFYPFYGMDQQQQWNRPHKLWNMRHMKIEKNGVFVILLWQCTLYYQSIKARRVALQKGANKFQFIAVGCCFKNSATRKTCLALDSRASKSSITKRIYSTPTLNPVWDKRSSMAERRKKMQQHEVKKDKNWGGEKHSHVFVIMVLCLPMTPRLHATP